MNITIVLLIIATFWIVVLYQKISSLKQEVSILSNLVVGYGKITEYWRNNYVRVNRKYAKIIKVNHSK